MPIFEYRCTKCGEVEEHLVLNRDKSPVKCCACGGKLKQLISQSSFQLLGDGWYKTSYQGNKNKNKSNDK